MRVLVAALFLSLAAAGCLNDPVADPVVPPGPENLSAAVFDILPVEEVFVTASDGVRMHNAVYRPDVPADLTVPVFINFSPYWGDDAENGGDNFAQYMVAEYVPRGYAVVLSAVRGTGHSEGCFEVASDRELMDVYDVVDSFANEPWSNGAVAAGGKSYDSTTQNGMIAKYPHAALKGIFHVSGITDMYRYNYVNGVPYSNGLTFTPRYAQQYGTEGTHPEGPLGAADDYGCPEMAEHVLSGTGSAASGQKDAYWVERDWNRYIGDSDWNGSIFFVHGFQDWNVKPDHILPWIAALPASIEVKGWLHQDTENSGHVYPMRGDWNQTMLMWLDHVLKGTDSGWDGLPAWDVEATDGLWRHLDAWPPEAVDAGLEVRASNGFTMETVVDVAALGMGNETGHTHITGAPLISVTPLFNSEDPVAVATLELNGQWVGEAVLRVIYREGLDLPAPVVPGTVETLHLEAYPLDIIVGPEDELTVTFGGEPRYSIVTPAQYSGLQYSHPMGPGPMGISLPIADATARVAQPVAVECFAC